MPEPPIPDIHIIGRTVHRMVELPTPGEYIVALMTATKTGRRTPYVVRLLDAPHVALIVHGAPVLLGQPAPV